MNRKNLTAAVLAGLAGVAGIASTAQAVNINPDGLGQVLIYPYYTVNGGNTTVLSVVNSSEDAKAVKVRFLEGQNTREVLDFNLYLSAYDVWTAAIVDAAGTPTLVTADTSCIVPDFGGTQAFLPYALDDGGSEDISRAAEGHFEMIEMGTLLNVPNKVPDPKDAKKEIDIGTYSAKAATHKDGVPNDCDQLNDAWTWEDEFDPKTKGYWLDDPFVDMDPPSGGLFGAASIVDVQGGAMYSYDAKAINGFATTVDAEDILHQEPGSVLPSLNSGDVRTGYVFTDQGAQWSDDFERGVDAVSYVFMHDSIMNEYTVGGDLNAQTEWVVTFPTKHFYVYAPSAGAVDTKGNPLPEFDGLDPFTSEWYTTDIIDKVTKKKTGEILTLPCEIVSLDTIWDQEERTLPKPDEPEGGTIPPVVSPKPPPVTGPGPDPLIPFELCYETNVIRFGANPGDTTEILGSSNFTNIDNETGLNFEAGWVRLELDDFLTDDAPAGGDGVGEENSRGSLGNLQGLPVTGFSVFRAGNAFLGDGADVLANYGGIFQHKATRKLGEADRVDPND